MTWDDLVHKITFRKTVTSVVVVLFVHMHFTVFELVRGGFLGGDVFMTGYVVSLTGGVVTLVNGLWSKQWV